MKEQIPTHENIDCPYERRMQAILDAMPDLVIILDTNGYFTGFNQKKDRPELYKPPSEWIGMHHTKVLPKAVADQFEASYDRILEGSVHETLEYPLHVMDGSDRFFSAIVTPVYNKKELVSEFCCVIKDITKEKESEDAMRETLKYLSGREKRMIELKEEIKKLKEDGEINLS